MNGEIGVDFSAVTDVGCSRDHNEDNHLANSDLGLWVVADGMGGHEGGEVASALAVEIIEQKIMAGNTLTDAVQMAHHAILDAVTHGQGKKGMGSTVVALRMESNHYEIAWVGDSRAYLWTGQLRQLTRDHSFVQKLLDAGAITEEEALEHPDKSVIAQALGADCESVEVDTVSGKLYRGEKILLCSDGLTGEVDDQQIATLLADHEDESVIAKRLVNTALNNGGSDNVTLILLGGSDSFPQRQAVAKTVPFDAHALNQQLKTSSFDYRYLYAGIGIVAVLLICWIVFAGASNKDSIAQPRSTLRPVQTHTETTGTGNHAIGALSTNNMQTNQK